VTAVIINEKLFQLEDQCQIIVDQIWTSSLMQEYLENKKQMACCPEAAALKQQFLEKKAAFEKIADYGKYAPGFREKQREVRKAKRELDMNEKVAEFRVSETKLQAVLDQIVQQIAQEFSEEVKVDAGNPFFETKKHSGCGGSCHAGR
jgi:cell fate (sporulation/competence/biofilm development) regulator YlbF (YheA/YmcA/DUF963 family)